MADQSSHFLSKLLELKARVNTSCQDLRGVQGQGTVSITQATGILLVKRTRPSYPRITVPRFLLTVRYGAYVHLTITIDLEKPPLTFHTLDSRWIRRDLRSGRRQQKNQIPLEPCLRCVAGFSNTQSL